MSVMATFTFSDFEARIFWRGPFSRDETFAMLGQYTESRPADWPSTTPLFASRKSLANVPASPIWLYESTYLRVGELAESKVIVLERSGVPTAGADINAVFDPAEQAIRAVRRDRYGLLIDVRAARGRNDAEFEKKFEPIRQSIQRGFRRVAILVVSPQGKLQAGRYAREDGLANSVFDDYAAALKWLEEATLLPSGLGPPSPGARKN